MKFKIPSVECHLGDGGFMLGLNDTVSFLGNEFLKVKSNFMAIEPSEIYKKQQQNFKKFKNDLKGTKIYQDLELDSVENYEEFVSKVPVWQYEDYAPYVDLILQGDENILFKDEIKYFGLTSGTSGNNSKRVPYNEAMINTFLAAQKQVAGRLAKLEKNVNILNIDRMAFGSAPFLYEENGFKFGYISGILSTKVPKILTDHTFPKAQTLEIADWDLKITKLIEESLQRDIQIVSGIPTYLISIFEEVLKKTGKQKLNQIWPNLKIFVYAATPIKQYQDRINELVGHGLNYYGLYAATEAPIGLAFKSFDGKNQKYILNPDLLYSFTPVQSLMDPKNSKTNVPISVDQIEMGVPYYINIGTPNGFIHYAMKDVIKFSIEHGNLVFEFVGRKAAGMNLAAEKVSDDEILNCIQHTKKVFNLDIRHFFLSPGTNMGKSCYQWTLFIPEVENVPQNSIASYLDQTLAKINLDYKECRDDEILQAPIVRIMNAQNIKSYFERNRNKGQFKMKTTFETSAEFNDFMKTEVILN